MLFRNGLLFECIHTKNAEVSMPSWGVPNRPGKCGFLREAWHCVEVRVDATSSKHPPCLFSQLCILISSGAVLLYRLPAWWKEPRQTMLTVSKSVCLMSPVCPNRNVKIGHAVCSANSVTSNSSSAFCTLPLSSSTSTPDFQHPVLSPICRLIWRSLITSSRTPYMPTEASLNSAATAGTCGR